MNLDVDYLIDFFNKNSYPNFEEKIDGELGEQEAAAAPTGGGGGATPTVDNSAVPSFVPGNLFGQGNASNNVSQSQGVETNQTITVQAVVSETEMTINASNQASQAIGAEAAPQHQR